MDLSGLPTDNVYQFMALAGLLLVVVSMLGPWREWERLEQKRMDATREMKTIKVEVDAVERQLQLQMKVLEGCGAVFNEDGSWEVPPKISTEEGKNINQALERLQERSTEAQRAQARNTALLDYVNAATKRLNWLLSVAVASGLLGLILSGVGFYLWYDRIQVLQDELLQRQLNPPAAVTEPNS